MRGSSPCPSAEVIGRRWGIRPVRSGTIDLAPPPTRGRRETGLAESVAAGYRRLVRRRIFLLLLIAVAGFAAFSIDLVTGPSDLTIGEAIRGLFTPGRLDRARSIIIWEVRLPYALMAILVGAALSLSGAEMQTILNNPLASPFTLGVSAAATLGAALAIVIGITLPGIPQSWFVSANAFIFAFGSVLLLQALSRMRGTGTETLVLFGIAVVFTFNALVALIQFIASEHALQQLVFWSMGSLSLASWEKIRVLAVVIALVAPFSFRAAWRLTALRLGEDRARSFGIDVGRLRFGALFRVSLLAAAAVAFVGTIGFIGLVGPHITRLLIGEDHRFLLPGSALMGALIMSLTSVASKTIVPGVLLPIGIVTSLIGVPVFLSLVLTRKERV